MKKGFLTILTLCLIKVCFSQVPNSSFENWTNMGSYFNPTSWGTMNNTTSLSGIFTATMGSPGSPGSYFLNLTSQTIEGTVINGIAVSGVLDSITLLPKSGFPFSQRPQSFTGKYQHMIAFGSTQGSISAVLTHWNAFLEKKDTVATAFEKLYGMVMTWEDFTIDFTYNTGEFPDTCIVILESSGESPSQDDYLFIDSLGFYGNVVGISENIASPLSLFAFPNPASDKITFTSSGSISKGSLIFIYDILGNVVFVKPINQCTFEINTTEFVNGFYLFSLINESGVYYSGGKFTILN
jgi:hypothetical protein